MVAADSLATSLSLLDKSQGGPARLMAFGGGPGPIDWGPDLVDLIERTINPAFWDVVGGPGSIVYYRPLQCLVVRATAEVHGQDRRACGRAAVKLVAAIRLRGCDSTQRRSPQSPRLRIGPVWQETIKKLEPPRPCCATAALSRCFRAYAVWPASRGVSIVQPKPGGPALPRHLPIEAEPSGAAELLLLLLRGLLLLLLGSFLLGHSTSSR